MNAQPRPIEVLRSLPPAQMTDEEFLRVRADCYLKAPTYHISLLEFMGTSPEEYADWFLSGVIPERVMRVDGRRPGRWASPGVQEYPDLCWHTVTCRTCQETYTCTPEHDYYGDPEEPGPRSNTEGRCWACMLAAANVPHTPESQASVLAPGNVVPPR